MSTEAVEAFLRDVLRKGSFAVQVRTDPSVLNGYDLTMEEKRALRTHDRKTLLAWGIPRELLEALEALPLADDG